MPATNRTTITGQHVTTVVGRDDLAEGAFVLRLERQGLDFHPGQCVVLGVAGARDQREYSIYSSVQAETLDVLIREVDNGNVSRQLHRCAPGARVTLDGPAGFFTLDDVDIARDELLFVATGTGIAPFHSMVASQPELNYRVLHGVRTVAEAYGRDTFARERYVLCTSRDHAGDFAGRVTDYLRAHPASKAARCLLCGNVKMIDDVYDVLAGQSVATENIRAEVYF